MSRKAISKAVILAGGKGVRMGQLGQTVPKVLLKIGGTTLLEHWLFSFADCKVTDVFLCVHHLKREIEKALSGMRIAAPIVHIVEDNPPMGTAGALKKLEPMLQDDFFVAYGDIFCQMDLNGLAHFQRQHRAEATLVVHPNDHPADSDLIEVNPNGYVTQIWPKHSRPQNKYYANLVNAALYVLSPSVLECIPSDQPSDFASDLLPYLLKEGKRIAAYRTNEYLKDIGTPERLDEVRKDWECGRAGNNPSTKARPAIFLDRDGVINRDFGHLSRLEDFELLPTAGEAIRLLNRSGYLAVIISNQPVIARGELDEEGLAEMERKMEWLLGQQGAFVDAAYYCPHHPDRGFPGERTELKIKCDCRKPGIGLIKRAVSEWNIDLKSSWMIGDKASDVEAGHRAGTRTVLLNGVSEGPLARETALDLRARDLKDAVTKILAFNGIR